jgi:hypothetical protein
MTDIPLPAGLPLDAVMWGQTPLVVRQVVVHPLAVIQQQAGRIAALEACLSQHSNNSDRPPSSDCWPAIGIDGMRRASSPGRWSGRWAPFGRSW